MFQRGDRIIVHLQYHSIVEGCTGEIMDVGTEPQYSIDEPIAISFDTDIGGHDCDGRVPNYGHGYFLPKENISIDTGEALLHVSEILKIGDRVITTQSYGNALKGAKGSVANIPTLTRVAIRFDTPILGGHTCDLNIKDGYGYFVPKFRLKKIEAESA